MSSQLTLNLDGTMVSITPQDGQRTVLEIVTNDGLSSLKSLHTEDMQIETKESMKVRELPPINKNKFKNINNDFDDIDQMDPIEELKMYDDEKSHIKPLNLDYLEEDEEEDIVEKMTSDLEQPSAMNYGRHMELPEKDDNLDFKPGPVVELENDKPYEKVELTNEDDIDLEEYDNDNVSSISRILEHEKQLSEQDEEELELEFSEEDLQALNDIESEVKDYARENDNYEDSENNLTVDSNESSQESQINDDNAFLERDRKKEQTTSLSFKPDEEDYGEDETQF